MQPEQKPIKKRTGLYIAGAGVAMLAIGYVALAKGSITLAPALIIGAFVVMGIGILTGWD